MSAAVFQSALARLVVDPDFRDAVRGRGESALPGGLSGLERERLTAVAGHPGLDVTRTLHKGFRLSKLLTWLPLTCSMLDSETLGRELGEFWRRRLPVSFYYLEEAVAFCDYLLERVEEGLEAPCLGEVAAYERASLELQRARPAGEAPEPQVVELRHDPFELLSAVGRGERPLDLPEHPCLLIGTKDGGRIEWRVREAQSLHQS
jgi:hypothetical protein